MIRAIIVNAITVGVVLCAAVPVREVSAFSTTSNSAIICIDIRETIPRNIEGLKKWAKDCGIDTCKGFRLVSDPVDEQDWSVSTSKSLSANDVVLTVPSELLLSSAQIDTFVSTPYQTSFQKAEQQLEEDGLADQIPLFRLYVILLLHYEVGDQSPYFAWLDALPRRFYNGVVMTSACFECLPPYVRYLSEMERDTCQSFRRALATTRIVTETTASNTELLNWAYCVVVTRSLEINGSAGEIIRVIAPMADMFNHGSFENEVDLAFDQSGNVQVYATRTLSPGTNLRLCYGDPTNPSLFFAKYGFLDKSPATFCKLMHLQQEMAELQLEFSDLLFYRESGEISPQVWDLLLYSILKQLPEDARQEQLQGFYEAYMMGEVDAKNLYHRHYFQYTHQALSDHVNGTLEELDSLSELAKTKDIAKHPRLSLILKHNNFVKDTFLKVRANLDAMLS